MLKTVVCLRFFPGEGFWLLLGVIVGFVWQLMGWSVFGVKVEIVLIGALAAFDIYIGAHFVRSCLKGRGRGGWSHELAIKELAERKGKISVRRVAYLWMGLGISAKAGVLGASIFGRLLGYVIWRTV